MIRINLLPVPKARKVKKAAELQYELILAALVIGLVLLACGYSWFHLEGQLDLLQAEKSKDSKELAALKEKVKEVENYENNKKKLQERNGIIEQLRKNQGAPVHLLDQISRSMDTLKIWLTTLSAREGQINIDGKSITNSDIVEFINILKSSKFFTDVQLIESRQGMESNIPVYNFKLRCTLVI